MNVLISKKNKYRQYFEIEEIEKINNYKIYNNIDKEKYLKSENFYQVQKLESLEDMVETIYNDIFKNNFNDKNIFIFRYIRYLENKELKLLKLEEKYQELEDIEFSNKLTLIKEEKYSNYFLTKKLI